MNNGQQSSEPRPALETEDIKSQLNAIVAPYGILFPESMEEESSMSLNLTNPFSLGTSIGQSTNGQTLTATSTFSPGEILKTVSRQPTMSAADGESLGIQSAQGSVVESTAEKTFAEGRWSSLDGSSPESRGGPQSNKGGVTKSGSKLVKGWKKFRQSLKVGTTLSNSPSSTPPLFGSHSSIAEDATRSDDSPAVSSVGEQRKALSDLDRPSEMGAEDNLLDSGPVFGTGLTHKFSSGSLKGLLLKGSSISSVKDLDVALLPPIRSRATLESHNKLARGEGVVVVDTESVMSLGKMKQYGKEDWIAQQQQRLIQHSRSSSKHHPSEPFGAGDPSISGDVPATREHATIGGADAVATTGISPTPGAEVTRDGAEDLIAPSGYAESEKEETSIPVVSVIEPTDTVIVMETADEGPGVVLDIDIEDTPTVVPRENRLGQDLATSQQWRLSTQGTPKVVGSICERRGSGVSDNEVYLQRLMQDSVAPEQEPSESGQPEENEEDHMDNAFKVPLYQSVQLASAMFDNGQRIPLVLYYVTEELRARVSRGDVVETIDNLFPVNWEESDEEFEKLVEVFDQRPFGQFFDLSLDPPVVPPPSDIDNHVHPFDETAPEADTTKEDNTEQTESSDDIPTAPVEPAKPRVSSRDLSRLILRFLKDLPEPLIPTDIFSTFSAMTKLQTLDSVKIQASSLLVQLLSTEHRELLQFLLEFLDEVILRSLRDELERLEHPDPAQPLEHEPKLPELGDKYKDTLDRLSNILGVVISHATIRSETGTGAGAEKQQSQTSLYRHYKRDFELKALQEQNALAIRNSAAVFQSLMTFRTTIFGDTSFSLGQENKDEYGSDRSHAQGSSVEQDDQSSVTGSVCDMDSDYEYQSDSALYEVTSKRPLGRRQLGSKSPNSPKRPLTKSKTLHSRHHHHHRQLRRGCKQRKRDVSLAVTTSEDEGADGQARVQKKTSTDTLCDSAVDMTTNVDVVALAAMQEHMARSLRNQKHLPRPSVATLHSILAETQSVIGGAVNALHSTAAAATAVAGTGVEAGAAATAAEEGDVMTDDAASMVGGAARTECGEAATADRSGRRQTGKGEGEADDGGEGETYDREMGFGHAAKTKLKYGFVDFLQEPLDRKQEEREIQLVEKEILRSEITTKFLAANLAGLYPSSSQTAIPSVILPSARSTLLPQTSSRSSTDALAVPQASNESSTTVGTPALSRELTLEPQEQIQLPDDHRASDNCSCSYCTTLVQPSQIPVLTRDEYEKAELQSQCDAKDQHIAELLKTVQSLQGEVNILNAKLLFLHDHHTTRPMRRRTLARNSFPTVPCSNAPGGDWSSRQQYQPLQQLSDPPSSAPQMGQTSSYSPPTSANAAAAGGNGYSSLQGSPKLFAEGIQMSNNADTQMSRGKSRHISLGWEYGHNGGQDLSTLEEDEAMSFLDLDDPQHPPPPPFPTNNSAQRPGRPGFGLREVVEEDEEDHELEREGEDLLDEFYYMDAYKTMDQQLYRRPILPIAAPPRPMSTDQYKKHHRMSLPIQNLSKRLSLGQTFRWKGRATAA